MNLDINVDIDSVRKLEEHIRKVRRYAQMQTDTELQKYIQNKVLETVIRVTDERLVGGTTDDEYIEEYKNRHKIQQVPNGFILYNDTVLPTSMLPVSEKTAQNYPNGFSIALAFEYGIGIIGENDPKLNAWEYNVNKHNFAWYFSKYGEKFATYGYSGFEIYRFTAEEVERNLNKWVNEYFDPYSRIEV